MICCHGRNLLKISEIEARVQRKTLQNLRKAQMIFEQQFERLQDMSNRTQIIKYIRAGLHTAYITLYYLLCLNLIFHMH